MLSRKDSDLTKTYFIFSGLRQVRRDPAVAAGAAVHHESHDRADPVRQALRRGAGGLPAAGDAAGRRR